ncbi:MAG: CBS domain-containing protein [Chloroflexi bacterium]|nr:CBS domain-containing protein [Chloroflexota bacterium]
MITVTSETRLFDAETLLERHKIRRLPVLENGRLAGIVTHTDLCGVRPSSVEAVGQIMAVDLITVSQDATVGEAAQLMLKHKIGGLPVVNANNKLVGIITESDIFRLVVHDWMRADDSAEPYARYK